MTRRALLPLLACLAALALPGSALAADSGSISDVKLVGGDRVSATFTATSERCGPSGYCGFFAYARMVAADTACMNGVGKAIWVSDDIASQSGTLRGTATFARPDEPVRICLWLYQAGDRETAITQAVIDPASLSTTPQTPPQGAGVAVPAPTGPAATPQTAPSSNPARPRTAARLALSKARIKVARALARKYGRAYRRGTAKVITCSRVSTVRYRCKVSWRYRGRRYRGTVVATSTVSGVVATRVSVRRSRAR